jgi:hypothetical protein
MLAYLFVILAFASRFLPHPWHFTPVAASLLFFGAYAARRSFWFPLGLLALADVILTKYVYGFPITWDHFVTWAWYGAILLLGTRLRENSKPLWILASAMASSVSFFLVSNFAVWACFNMYPKTFAGLMTAYAMGLPFFQRGLAGDLLFTGAMFATPALLRLPEALRHGSGRAAA